MKPKTIKIDEVEYIQKDGYKPAQQLEVLDFELTIDEKIGINISNIINEATSSLEVVFDKKEREGGDALYIFLEVWENHLKTTHKKNKIKIKIEDDNK